MSMDFDKPQSLPRHMDPTDTYDIASYPSANAQTQSYINQQQPIQHQQHQHQQQHHQQHAYPAQPHAGPSSGRPASQTIAPALLQQLSAGDRKPTPVELAQASGSASAAPAASGSLSTLAPAPPAPLSAKAVAKRPIKKETFDLVADNRLFGEVAAEAAFKASLAAGAPNHLTKLVELLRPRSVPEGASASEARELRKPRVVMAAETAQEVFERMNRSATTRYLKAWSRDARAMAVFAYYLEVANHGVPDDKEFGVWMHAAHAILVVRLRDPSLVEGGAPADEDAGRS